MDKIFNFDDGVDISLEAMLRASKQETAEINMVQKASQKTLLQETEDAIPLWREIKMQRKPLEDRAGQIKRGQASGIKEAIIPVAKLQETAERFQRKNPELQAKMLLALRETLHPKDGRDEILRKVSQFYEDVSLQDEALAFLEETTTGELRNEVVAARAELNSKFGRDIIAGRNIGAKAREFAEKGLGAPTALRDLYREITHNPRDSATLFKELSDRYPYKDLKEVIKFMFHALGADMKSKGPSISHALLSRLITETRSLQAIMGVYRFFGGRMHLMERLFNNSGIPIPKELTFELLAKHFMSLVTDRYPTPEKILDGAKRLGLEKWLQAQIIVLSQMRDGVREVAINQIYSSLKHRDDLLGAVIEALMELEDQVDEAEENDEDAIDDMDIDDIDDEDDDKMEL